MQKFSAADFYLRISAWTFVCLIFAVFLTQVGNLVLNASNREKEAAVVGIIATIRDLQTIYAAKHRGNFAPSLHELVKSENLDERFGGESPVVSGYVFEMSAVEATEKNPAFYSIHADPAMPAEYYETGLRHFYFDSTLGTTIQTEENRHANADDPPL